MQPEFSAVTAAQTVTTIFTYVEIAVSMIPMPIMSVVNLRLNGFVTKKRQIIAITFSPAQRAAGGGSGGILSARSNLHLISCSGIEANVVSFHLF